MSQEGADTTDQVHGFKLGADTYCVSIDYATEIADMGDLISISNSPAQEVGVIDLRGTTISIVDAKVDLNLEGECGDRIVIFDSSLYEDDRSVGWAVDSVEEVAAIDPEDVDDSPIDREYVHRLIKREDEFDVWIKRCGRRRLRRG